MADEITSSEVQSRGISLYKSKSLEVFIPKQPKIPLNNGLEIQVSRLHDRSDSPKEVLLRHLSLSVNKCV